MMIWPFNRENNHSAADASERKTAIVSDPLRLLAAVAQVLPDPFIVTDGDGFVIICNPAAEDIIEMPVIGQPIAHAIRSPVILDALAEVLAGADALKVEFAHRVPLERRFEAFIAAIGPKHGP